MAETKDKTRDKAKDKVEGPSRKPDLRYALTGALIVIFLVAAVFFLKERKAEEKAKQPATLPSVAYFPVPKTRGPDSAPIKLVEYSDFECPACRTVEGTLNELFSAYPGKIQLTYHHFPLSGHKWSIYAHQAAECMHIQGKFWAFHKLVYERQAAWTAVIKPPVEILAQYAKECGADMNLFSSCMADEAVARGIYAEKEEGSKKDISATPTLFLGEQRFVGPEEIKGRGQNAIRKVLGLPPLPVPEKKEATAPAPGPAPASPSLLPPPLIQTNETKK